MAETKERYPIEEAERVIADRVSRGSTVLAIEGVWVRDGDAHPKPDPEYTADLSPDGLTDETAVAEVIQDWPRDEAFCLEILFVTPK